MPTELSQWYVHNYLLCTWGYKIRPGFDPRLGKPYGCSYLRGIGPDATVDSFESGKLNNFPNNQPFSSRQSYMLTGEIC